MRKLKLYSACALLILSLCGFSVFGKKKDKEIPPRLLLLGIQGDNADIAGKIGEGVLSNITPKVEAFGPAGFELLISSITRKRAGLPLAASSDNSAPPSDLKPVIDFSSSTFYSQLSKSQYFRTKVNLETGLDYVVIGEAKEQKLSELEQGNLLTAETASIKMMDLKSGEFVVKDQFKQGLLEIVAPERIGIKLAGRINKYLATVRKEEKRESKQLQKKFEE